MLLRNSLGLLRKIDITVGPFCQDFSVIANTLHTHHQLPLSLQFLSRLQFGTPRHHVRRLESDSSTGSSLSDNDTDKLCVYQPDVRRIRIVTMNDVEADDVMQDASLSQSSVQRDTVYTRQHVSTDNPTVQSLFQGICEGSRSALARAITLVESVHPKRQAEAQVLLREVLEYSRKKQRHSLHRLNSFRIGNILYSMMMMMMIMMMIVLAST